MYCSNCGTKVPDSSKFCPSCGIEVGKAKSAKSVDGVSDVTPTPRQSPTGHSTTAKWLMGLLAFRAAGQLLGIDDNETLAIVFCGLYVAALWGVYTRKSWGTIIVYVMIGLEVLGLLAVGAQKEPGSLFGIIAFDVALVVLATKVRRQVRN